LSADGAALEPSGVLGLVDLGSLEKKNEKLVPSAWDRLPEPVLWWQRRALAVYLALLDSTGHRAGHVCTRLRLASKPTPKSSSRRAAWRSRARSVHSFELLGV